jgi:DNA-binding response OmpR family regulator
LILAVDDDVLTCRLMEALLGSVGYEVISVHSARDALSEVQKRVPDLVLLDVQLPDLDGFTLMRQLKQAYRHLAVIMLTARAEVQDRLTGFQAGADDYVVKPFEPAELVARVNAVIRRATRHARELLSDVITENGLTLNVSALKVELPDGRQVLLTPTETRILHRLMANPNHVISRDNLAAYAAGYAGDTSDSHTNVYIGRIRNKLSDDPNNPRYIETVRGSGYRFLAPDSTTSLARKPPA